MGILQRNVKMVKMQIQLRMMCRYWLILSHFSHLITHFTPTVFHNGLDLNNKCIVIGQCRFTASPNSRVTEKLKWVHCCWLKFEIKKIWMNFVVYLCSFIMISGLKSFGPMIVTDYFQPKIATWARILALINGYITRGKKFNVFLSHNIESAMVGWDLVQDHDCTKSFIQSFWELFNSSVMCTIQISCKTFVRGLLLQKIS